MRVLHSRRRGWGQAIAGHATAGWAARDCISHDTGKQTTAIDTGAAMKRLGQMILLMCGAPQRHILARLAKMNWLVSRTLGHLAPMTVAHPAEIATDITDYHGDIRALELIAHCVHLCITVLATQHARVIDLRVAGDQLMPRVGSRCAFVHSL